GQGVEEAGGQMGRDQEVARPLGGRLGQVRGLDLQEPAPAEDPAQGGVGRGPDLQAAPGRGPAQVQVAVPEAQGLVGVGAALQREWRGLAGGQRPARGRGVSSASPRPSSGNGGVSEGASTSTSAAATSTSPVASSGFSLPAGRARTVPATRTQSSVRMAGAAGVSSGGATTRHNPDAGAEG